MLFLKNSRDNQNIYGNIFPDFNPQKITKLSWAAKKEVASLSKKNKKKIFIPCPNEENSKAVLPMPETIPLKSSQIPACQNSKLSSHTAVYLLMATLDFQFKKFVPPNDIKSFDAIRIPENINEEKFNEMLTSHLMIGLISASITASGRGIEKMPFLYTQEKALEACENLGLGLRYVLDLAVKKREIFSNNVSNKFLGKLTLNEIKTIASLVLNGEKKPMPFRSTNLETGCFEFAAPEMINELMATTVLDLLNNALMDAANNAEPEIHPVLRHAQLNCLLTGLRVLKNGNYRFAALINILLDLIAGYIPTTDIHGLRVSYSYIMKLATNPKDNKVLSDQNVLSCYAIAFNDDKADDMSSFPHYRLFTPMPFLQYNALSDIDELFINQEGTSSFLSIMQLQFEQLVSEKKSASIYVYDKFKNLLPDKPNQSFKI